MARQTVAVALPREELAPVERELAAAGYDVVPIASPEEFGTLLESRRDFALAVLDGERDFDQSLEYYSLLHENGRDIPALMVVSPRNLERRRRPRRRRRRSTTSTSPGPYSADSLRWRVEAMLIRAHTVDDGKGPIIESDNGLDSAAWTKRATVVCVFNPKGGVGKTTISINLAATLQVRPRPARAARGRRHGDRPHRQLARPRPGPDRRRRLGGRPGRRERLSRRWPSWRPTTRTGSDRGPDDPAPRQWQPRPGPRRRGTCPTRARATTSSSSTCTVVRAGQPGDLRAGRPDPRADHPRRARPAGRRSS